MEEKYRISDVNVTQGTKVVVGGVVKDQVDFDSDPQTQINNINAKVSAVYIPQGSIPALVLLDETPSEDNLGYVWNVTGEFITNDKFIEGAGKKYPDGTNVTVIKHTTDKYYFDILGTNIDLSQYSTTEEINTMLATRVEHITHQVTNNIQQSDATAILNNYSQFNGKFIEFLTNTNKSIGWGFVSTDSDNKQYLIVINNDGTITQWNKTTFEKHNFETKSLIGETIDIDNLTIDVAGEAPFLVSVRNAVNKPEKTGTDGYVIVVAVTVNQQIQYYTDIATNKQYYRLVSGVANSHSFSVWVEMGAGQATADTLGLVKAVEATEDMTQDVGITTEGKLVTKAGGGGGGIDPSEEWLDTSKWDPNLTYFLFKNDSTYDSNVVGKIECKENCKVNYNTGKGWETVTYLNRDIPSDYKNKYFLITIDGSINMDSLGTTSKGLMAIKMQLGKSLIGWPFQIRIEECPYLTDIIFNYTPQGGTSPTGDRPINFPKNCPELINFSVPNPYMFYDLIEVCRIANGFENCPKLKEIPTIVFNQLREIPNLCLGDVQLKHCGICSVNIPQTEGYSIGGAFKQCYNLLTIGSIRFNTLQIGNSQLFNDCHNLISCGLESLKGQFDFTNTRSLTGANIFQIIITQPKQKTGTKLTHKLTKAQYAAFTQEMKDACAANGYNVVSE